ncbi:MAG: hypothetical protein R6X34_01020 [Chloroflexota bacterium]
MKHREAFDRGWFGWHVFALTMVLMVMGWRLAISRTFFTVDTALRFLQVRSLIDQDWQTLAAIYPARFADPNLQFVPYYYGYGVVQDEIYLSISPFFPWLSSYLYVWLGWLGLVVLPVMGGVLTAVFIYKLGQLAGVKHPRWLFWSTVLATPLLFYSLEFWDHSIGAALAAGTVYLLAKGMVTRQKLPAFLGGVALGLGLGQRPELYMFALVVGVIFLWMSWRSWQQWLAFFTGGLLVTLPLWLWQYRWVGHPLGMGVAPNLFGYGQPEARIFEGAVILSPIAKKGRFLFYIEGRDLVTFLAACAVLLGIVILVWVVRVPKLQKPKWMWAGTILCAVGYLLYAITAWRHPVTGVLSTFALMPFVLFYVPNNGLAAQTHRIYRFVGGTAALFGLLMFLIWPTYGGEHQWGARYLLPIYPLFLFITFYVYTYYEPHLDVVLQKSFRSAFYGLLVLSFVLQVASVHYLYRVRQDNGLVLDIVENLPIEIIITNHPFLPTDMSAAEDKGFLYVADITGMEIVLPQLYANGIRRIGLIPLVPYAWEEYTGDIILEEAASFVYDLRQSQRP